MIGLFKPGDIVSSVITGSVPFWGVVMRVEPKVNKVVVAWGGGSEVQHDPDEIQQALFVDGATRVRLQAISGVRVASGMLNPLRSRRDYGSADKTAEITGDDPQYVGDPKTHGMDEPRGGGFSIMQNLAEDLHKESLEEAKKGEPRVMSRRSSLSLEYRSARIHWGRRDMVTGQAFGSGAKATYFYGAFREGSPPELHVFIGKNLGQIGKHPDRTIKVADFAEAMTAADKFENDLKHGKLASGGFRSRRGMYWCAPGRTYRLTQDEQASDAAVCPKCGGKMELEPFTKGEKMWRCPKCGFKVPTGKAVTKVEIEVDQDGEVEVEVTSASMRSRRMIG
jgi:ribosomal protein L37AE/L43A